MSKIVEHRADADRLLHTQSVTQYCCCSAGHTQWISVSGTLGTHRLGYIVRWVQQACKCAAADFEKTAKNRFAAAGPLADTAVLHPPFIVL